MFFYSVDRMGTGPNQMNALHVIFYLLMGKALRISTSAAALAAYTIEYWQYTP